MRIPRRRRSFSLLEDMVADYQGAYGQFIVNDFIRDKSFITHVTVEALM